MFTSQRDRKTEGKTVNFIIRIRIGDVEATPKCTKLSYDLVRSKLSKPLILKNQLRFTG
jgi:hypothetical protein